ncbi:hypothetical protein [Hyphomicrobium sp.]|uniref:hypothetical protein n=1 Tax=Hyphomicrobium sp. TaxID=82 RepID=UPI0035693664
MSTQLKFLWGTGVLTLLAAASAQATELCVKCTGPDANYACVVAGGSNATLDTVAKFYCITTLAKTGSHASCSIDRSVAAPCPGERRELPIPALLNDAADGESGGSDSATGKPPLDASAPPQNHTTLNTLEANTPPPPSDPAANATPSEPAANEPPPKTVQEMMEKSAKSAGGGLDQTQKTAGDAAKSAGTALEKAGSAVGGAAKSSWKCLSSFFSNC